MPLLSICAKDCNKCSSQLRIGTMEQLKDNTVFLCQDKRCKNTTCWHGGSFFAKSKLPLDNSIQIVCNFYFNTKKDTIICNFHFIRNVVVVSNK